MADYETADRNNHTQIINPYPYIFVQNTEPCLPEQKLLIVVHSSPKVSPTQPHSTQ